jgi:hypothetical protein
MGIVFIVLAIASFLYFGFLWTTASYLSFLWIWIVLGLLHLLMAFVYKAPEHFRKKPLFFRLRLFALSSYTLFFLLFSYLIGYLSQYRYGQWKDSLSYILVVGSELENNKTTALLRNRLERAALCYKENPEATLILSGGRGRHSASAEASVMYHSMLKMDIPAEAMLMEFYSKNTEEKISYGIESIFQEEQDRAVTAKHEKLRKAEAALKQRLAANQNQIIEYAEEAEEPGSEQSISIGIVSSQYHILRTCKYAEQALKKQREEGKVEASRKVSIVGFPSPEEPLLRPHLYFREALILLGERLCHKL